LTSAPEGPRLLEILERWAGRRVVVYGDLVLDEFLIGRIDRISREAPVLILEHRTVLRLPGGGANSAANVAALGGVPLPVGAVGDDAAGESLVAELRARGIETSGILRVPGYETPTKTRILAGSSTSVQQQVVRIDRGLREGPGEPACRELARRVAERRDGSDALLVSDYDHGALDPEARSALPGSWVDLVVTVDSRRHLARFHGMTAATPNLEEAGGALGRTVPDLDPEVASGAVALREQLGAASLAITRGSHGMTLVGPGDAPEHLPVFGTDEVADVTGAGDTVIAALTLALAAGAGIRDAAHLANVAAGLVVMKRGTATVSPAEMRRVLVP
jgi:rfaE bifunctional protein kinase chain/domain